jgi:hypothetical protein
MLTGPPGFMPDKCNSTPEIVVVIYWNVSHRVAPHSPARKIRQPDILLLSAPHTTLTSPEPRLYWRYKSSSASNVRRIIATMTPNWPTTSTNMDFDDAAPPPIDRIRRSPRAVLEHQKALDDFRFDDYSLDVEDFPARSPSPEQNQSPGGTPNHFKHTNSQLFASMGCSVPRATAAGCGTCASYSTAFSCKAQVLPSNW